MHNYFVPVGDDASWPTSTADFGWKHNNNRKISKKK